MAELVSPAEAVKIEYVCDECGEGKMVRCGSNVLDTYPVQYVHECDTCGFKQNFTSIYPGWGWR